MLGKDVSSLTAAACPSDPAMPCTWCDKTASAGHPVVTLKVRLWLLSLDAPCFSISVRVLSQLRSRSPDMPGSTHCSPYGKLPPGDTRIPANHSP